MIVFRGRVNGTCIVRDIAGWSGGPTFAPLEESKFCLILIASLLFPSLKVLSHIRLPFPSPAS